jgi:hypothetical protein
LKAPAFKPLKLKCGYPGFKVCFQIHLYRYSKVKFADDAGQEEEEEEREHEHPVGLYKLNAVDP